MRSWSPSAAYSLLTTCVWEGTMSSHRGKFVAYFRVSTDKQRKSGLGLEARRKPVLDYLDGGTSTIAASSHWRFDAALAVGLRPLATRGTFGQPDSSRSIGWSRLIQFSTRRSGQVGSARSSDMVLRLPGYRVQPRRSVVAVVENEAFAFPSIAWLGIACRVA